MKNMDSMTLKQWEGQDNVQEDEWGGVIYRFSDTHKLEKKQHELWLKFWCLLSCD